VSILVSLENSRNANITKIDTEVDKAVCRGSKMTNAPSYIKPERFSLKSHPVVNERWVQNRIAEDPKILGLGELILRDQERTQPKGGRLDLLLQDQETKRRFEVELQLGATDESHIIRTIEYWDTERKRYPQYDHCAVLIAEDITSRFLNVVSLFNGTIPLIAIQMQGFRVAEYSTLVFTTVMDEMSRGVIDEDEDAAAAPTDRAYWEEKSTKDNVLLMDQLFEIVKVTDPGLQLKYNKFYVGLSKDERPETFIHFRPQKKVLLFEIKLKRSDELDAMIEKAGFDTLGYDSQWGYYRLRLGKDDMKKHAELLRELARLSFEATHPS
jgi:hypothetical protein